MTIANELTIKQLESRLKNAMLNSDVEEIDNLLHDDLIFTNHLGFDFENNEENYKSN